MKRSLSRASVAGLSAALVAGAAFAAAPAASAAPIGTLAFSSGVNDGIWNDQVQDTFSVTTSAACPAGATNFQISITGPSVPAAPNNLIQGNTAGSTVGGVNTGSFTAPVAQTLAGFAASKGIPGGVLPAGTFTMELVCRAALASASLGEFVGQFQITSSGAVQPVLNQVATTTSITAATPASGDTNTPATFTASVSPANAVGTVQFKRNGTNIGGPVAKTAGSATVVSPSTGLLAAGSYDITAEFVGGTTASDEFGDSSSAVFPYSVDQVVVNTTTALSLSGLDANGDVTIPTPVTGSAVVTAGASAVTNGSVSFFLDGAASPFATDNNGSNGYTFSLPTGTLSSTTATPGAPHSIVAVYNGALGFNPSTSPAANFGVLAPAYDPDPQNIEVEIEPGTIVISTPYTPTSPLVLPAMVLNASATVYSSSAPFEDIIVTDTRPGNLPWTVSAIATDLLKDGVASPGVNERIDAQNVGLTAIGAVATNVTPSLFVGNLPAGSPNPGLPGANLSGFDNPAAAHVAAGTPGNLGLGGTSKKVLHANAGLGTSEFAGTLTITAPTNTLDGVYKGIVTFTVLGS